MKTKDYSKVKYVKPSVDGTDITKGKVYEVLNFIKYLVLHEILDDVGFKTLINLEDGTDACAYLKDGEWIPCDKHGNEI